jgi:hypothetical protein
MSAFDPKRTFIVQRRAVKLDGDRTGALASLGITKMQPSKRQNDGDIIFDKPSTNRGLIHRTVNPRHSLSSWKAVRASSSATRNWAWSNG